MKLVYDREGTPGFITGGDVDAFHGMGLLHARHRPLQSLLLASGARGRLAESIAPVGDLVHIDAIARRLEIPRRAHEEVRALDAWALDRIDAYLAGFEHGLAAGGRPFELVLLLARLEAPDRASLVGGFLLFAYLGLAEGQERMERALVEALAEGAEPHLLERMFDPHLAGWDPALLSRLPRHVPIGFGARPLVVTGGSNAWAVGPSRSASGSALFAGDPHLMINQIPSLFFEIAARVGDSYWLGATIPGLPGMAVARTRHLAWSGTFAVADNVDFFVESLDGSRSTRPEVSPLATEEVIIRRRLRAPLRATFFRTPRGTLEIDRERRGLALATAWAGVERAGEAFSAYLRLPSCTSAEEAERVLERAHTLSLHFVLADRGGDVRYVQVGRIPRRTPGWSGLYPVRAEDGGWQSFYEGRGLPRERPEDGLVATANEARAAPDGGVLSTLAQPEYRRDRILSLLRSRRDHDVASFQAIQRDLVSLRGARLRPRLLDGLPPGPVRAALEAWDLSCDVESRGAHAFLLARNAALRALAPDLGGSWFHHMLERSEIGLWWTAALDRAIDDPSIWHGPRGDRLARELEQIARETPAPLGDTQRYELRHLVLGGLPPAAGFDRGPFPLPGTSATVCQGHVLALGDRARVVVAPAYRFVCDLGEDRAFSALPGGIDGSRWSRTYDRWLDEYRAGEYHALVPP